MPMSMTVTASGVATLCARSQAYSGQKISASTTARKMGLKIGDAKWSAASTSAQPATSMVAHPNDRPSTSGDSGIRRSVLAQTRPVPRDRQHQSNGGNHGDEHDQ